MVAEAVAVAEVVIAVFTFSVTPAVVFTPAAVSAPATFCRKLELTNDFLRFDSGSGADTPKPESTLYPPGGGAAPWLGRSDS